MDNLTFHAHADMELLSKYPLALTAGEECFIMQEDRVVFIGSRLRARRFIEMNEGEYRKDIKYHFQ